MATKKKITMHDVFRNPKYQGKHVVLAAGMIFTAKIGPLERIVPTAFRQTWVFGNL